MTQGENIRVWCTPFNRIPANESIASDSIDSSKSMEQTPLIPEPGIFLILPVFVSPITNSINRYVEKNLTNGVSSGSDFIEL
jgi:hypothetical protein